jgi:hypothetical protein
MGKHNSYSGFYLELVSELYRDIAERYSVTRRMQDTEIGVIQSRCSKEGISFLTKSLPRFGKAVDTALSSGTRLSVEGFTAPNGSTIPKFLGWLLSRVFDAFGCELDQPDPVAFKHFRQLVYLVYKLEIPYDKETEQSVLDSFVVVDNALPEVDASPFLNREGDQYIPRAELVLSDEWLKQARSTIARAVSSFDPTGDLIVPRHGPGVVATGESVLEKSKLSRIYKHLEIVYPFTEWMMYSANHVVDSINDRGLRRVTLVDEATAKVVLVPKDSRGPRLISCEPLEVQWIQQGLGRALVRHIESSRLTRGHVNFIDQQVNRRLAMEGSRNGQWVTLDMKEASDRVSLALVKYLFQDHPRLLEALLATRSPLTRLPDGTVVRLKKYAPMGSALCFPVESLVFWALAVSAIRLTGRTWRESIRSVYVYGDDIIVRKEDYTILLRLFPLVGLKFNDQKCCVARSFRESCGCDAYNGIDVTPIKLKTTWSPRRNPEVLASYVAFRNAMFHAKYFRTAELVKTQLNNRYGDIPYTNRITRYEDAIQENNPPNGNGKYASTIGSLVHLQRVDHEFVERRTSLPRSRHQSFFEVFEAWRRQLEVGRKDPRLSVSPRGEQKVSAIRGDLLHECESLGVTPGIAFYCTEPCGPANAELRLRRRYNRRNPDGSSYNRWEIESWASVPTKVQSFYDGYAELLRRFSGGYGSHGGNYALVRRNRLKRTWQEEL